MRHYDDPVESLSVPEVAERLGVTYQTARKLILDGKLPAARVGRVFRVQRSDLEQFARPGTTPAVRRRRTTPAEAHEGPAVLDDEAPRALRPRTVLAEELWGEGEIVLRKSGAPRP
jgi:excisionase family DNA binding protein